MILLYALVVLLLGACALMASLWVRLLERRFVRAAKAADEEKSNDTRRAEFIILKPPALPNSCWLA